MQGEETRSLAGLWTVKGRKKGISLDRLRITGICKRYLTDDAAYRDHDSKFLKDSTLCV